MIIDYKKKFVTILAVQCSNFEIQISIYENDFKKKTKKQIKN